MAICLVIQYSKEDFILLDSNNTYDNISYAFVSYFDFDSKSVKWHAWLGHVGQDRMSRLDRQGLLDRLTRVKLSRCEPCLASKAIIKPFGKAMRASSRLELIHSDIYVPLNVKACHAVTYFITLIDNYLRHAYVPIMRLL